MGSADVRLNVNDQARKLSVVHSVASKTSTPPKSRSVIDNYAGEADIN